MTTINPVHTSCKNCVFSIFDNNTQSGCFADYLNRYRNKNEEIIEVFDDEKEFFVINNKKCLGYRENSWFDQFNMESCSISDKLNKLRDENSIQYLLVIYLKDFNTNNLLDLEGQLKKLTHKPSKIIFIKHTDDVINTFERLDSLLKCSELNCPWVIRDMLDYTIAYDEIIHYIALTEIKYRFILSINKPTDIIKIVNKTNDIVFDKLDQFTVISDSSKSSFMFSGAVYRYSVFHENKDILQDYSEHIIV